MIYWCSIYDILMLDLWYIEGHWMMFCFHPVETPFPMDGSMVSNGWKQSFWWVETTWGISICSLSIGRSGEGKPFTATHCSSTCYTIRWIFLNSVFYFIFLTRSKRLHHASWKILATWQQPICFFLIFVPEFKNCNHEETVVICHSPADLCL